MAAVKLTKNELKRQKDQLRMFRRYLPTLQLKKQQLQAEIRGVEARSRSLAAERDALRSSFAPWIAVFGEAEAARGEGGKPLISVTSLRRGKGNVAGVEIPLFLGADFAVEPYDLWASPLWLDAGLESLSRLLLFDLELSVLREQEELLRSELRTTTQRVNLFEKVKIPEALESIRRIGIFLGDQQTAQVVRGKIAQRGREAQG